ncbi:sulfate permease [Marinobacter lutaoensis]|jgi:SulP family sulfate permease|uniref:Sodium-independent anion transporter n=1 Tax=Marinobacter lutaoensis TaxID=135739 RepID=A0A1V2DUA8_9GAMM|nr:sulfate permease [Marinobacter lutaoensis]MBI44163.1 sodium-independent anion transporter [Oceanospirillales bacterium]NVD34151.1 sulfate permease [Marinobacter lutaoensis]ONF44294.1 sodium-independent anion transporter [Marinobacter lutaoensis]|tara:strand:+ start:2321 stop:4057 length:1737 start_codon:yes stop_codon:yes gene_type:complete
MNRLKRYLPILQWAPGYGRDQATSDLVAALIVTVMLIPQSLAYALLAGLPAQVGLYASILPLAIYAVFGTSRTLSVGPVAVASLMTAAALAPIAEAGTDAYVAGAVLLAVMSGLMLTLMGVLKLGFLANFLSHPVISGFITASGLVIAASQLKHLLGIEASGHNLVDILLSLARNLAHTNLHTLAIGTGALLFLLWARRYLKPWLMALGMGARLADILTKTAPILSVLVTTWVAWAFGLAQAGVRLVGQVPSGLPSLTLPPLEPGLWSQLAVGALLISVVGFVESVSVGQTLAAKRRQRIDPDQELIGLGTANLGAGLSGGMPVTGGFSRSVVNFDAGAETPAAGAFTAVGIALATVFVTPAIAYLPKATLAATIIVAVVSLIDLPALVRTWRYSKADFGAMLATILLTLLHSVEAGIIAGVALSIGLFLYRTSRPHCAVVGRVPGTEHFRNVLRHQVELCPKVTFLRVDESLYFANARFLEETVLDLVNRERELRDLVLVCPAVNLIDASALESLEAINERLKDAGVRLHLSEVKGPVMDRLRDTELLAHLSGRVFLSTFEAWQALTERQPALARTA